MGFSNLCHEFLQPPLRVENAAQRKRRELRIAQDRMAAEPDPAVLREAIKAGRIAL